MNKDYDEFDMWVKTCLTKNDIYNAIFEGMTNGEIIEAVFHDNPIDKFIHDVNMRDGLNVVAHFEKEWWNKRYKGEDNLGEVK